MERKPRSDAKLFQLPEQDREKLFLSIEQAGYIATHKVCRQLIGTTASVGALHNFFKREAGIRQKAKFLKASALGDAIEQAGGRDFSPEFATSLSNTAMELSVAGQPDLAAQLLDMALAIKKDIRESGEFALNRQKFQRETLQLFVKWSQDAKARELAAAPGDAAARDEALGKHLFGEDWRS